MLHPNILKVETAADAAGLAADKIYRLCFSINYLPLTVFMVIVCISRLKIFLRRRRPI